MKKAVAMLLAICMAVGLAGCGGGMRGNYHRTSLLHCHLRQQLGEYLV